MSDAWDEIQAIKTKRNSLRERLEKRKKERQDILGTTSNAAAAADALPPSGVPETKVSPPPPTVDDEADDEVERQLLQILCDTTLELPISAVHLLERINSIRFKPTTTKVLNNLLEKLATQSYITIADATEATNYEVEVIVVDHLRVQSLYEETEDDGGDSSIVDKLFATDAQKRKCEIDLDETSNGSKISKLAAANGKKLCPTKALETTDIMSLLSMPSSREKQSKQVGEEILDLLSKPTAKERSLVEKFKSQGGAQVMEFCPHGTKAECDRHTPDELLDDKPSDVDRIHEKCYKLHFKKIIQAHTDESLGDCSFLNTCFHMDTCKYVHYEVDSSASTSSTPSKSLVAVDLDKSSRTIALGKTKTIDSSTALHPAQWIQCDLRFLDMTILGKFSVIMADPPWDIHMELPYGTMSDDEMRQLGVPALQDDGLIFLWVTGRAMELGRECLKLWGYERSDELIWVKTNQLQRIIRTGRTGHWLNHGKEHCLVGTKGNPANLNRGLDCDVITAEVRATSHKPDEVYGIIERLSPGTRKIELFGRPHNVQPNWVTLGNQLDGIRLVDPELISQFQKRYPDGNCMAPASGSTKPNSSK